ncbi:FAD-dependent oxidoreductase [Curtobacterium sp. VKM Ac-1376]|uniref:FAD-dependent oxidoreductase n=1 Tax=Curtobacterium sp. VKM Ac-1376 TaxID=123312 RepID=UPI00188C7CC4|nr:FAD-dependent oxidoreductase [Curtobacterium sp. VKM Ac-1376]MBF4616030.1 FAD-dependent oxidoreductase [Curtobacterium sp. VKM Ac-1376]
MLDATIGVIGLGANGSQILRILAARGASVLGIEQSTSPNDRSGHAGETRLISTIVPDPGPDGEDPILSRVGSAWDRYERDTGHSVLTRTGALSIDDADTPFMRGLAASARRRYGDDRAVLERADVAARFPQFRLDDGQIAVFDERGGGVRSEYAVSGAVQAARRDGAAVVSGVRVLGWATGASGVRVFCSDRDYRFDRIVVVTGAFVGDLLPELAVHARKLVMAWFAPRTDAVERFSRPDMPVFSIGTPEALGAYVYGAPSFDRPYVKVGGDFDWGYAEPPSSMDFALQERDLVGLRTKARNHFDGLTDSIVRSVKLMDGWTPDSEPLIGWHDPDARVALATGFSGHGFAISPVIGELVADLVTDRQPEIDLSRFDPARFEVGHSSVRSPALQLR